MEYSVHGSLHESMHGNSQHGGSLHSHGGVGGGMQGFLTPGGENGTPIVSSVHSPLVKSTFKQLGGVEDGWLIEMYYRASVTYQRSVFAVGENELRNLFKAIVELEDKRQKRLHELMLAFVPRQRRLFAGLPDDLNEMLDNLVGLRIDEESLQTLIDNSIKDRSRDHLRSSFQHKSSIMNRSRVQNTSDPEVEDVEVEFGNPFDSALVRFSNVVELKPVGIGSIVNKTWKVALAVVTSEGKFHLFELPEASSAGMDPREAFKALYPSMAFDKPETWVQGRKTDLVKAFTPHLTLDLSKCTIMVSKMQKRQFDLVEEKPQTGGNRLFPTNSQRQKKCTLRLPSASNTTEWVGILEKARKEFIQQRKSSSKSGMFKS